MWDIIFLVFVGLLWGCTNVLIKKGSEGVSQIRKSNPNLSNLKLSFLEGKYLLTKPSYIIPLLLNLSASTLFVYSLSQSQLGLVVPITNSVTIAFTIIFGQIFGEKPLNSWMIGGTFFVILGVFILAL